MTHDTKRLAQLGKRMQRLRDDTDTIRTDLHTEILAALANGVRQAEVVKLTGYTRDAIRQIVNRNRKRAVGDLPLRSITGGRGLDTPGARAPLT